jgi:hypothetical protein
MKVGLQGRLQFTGENPPVRLWPRFPNRQNANQEEGLPGQDETTRRPADNQETIDDETTRRMLDGMGWASQHITLLATGQSVSFRPRGNSMSGKIESGKFCTVDPIGDTALEVGDIVLCKVNGREYLHLIKAVHGDRYQIGNNRGRNNGWVARKAIFGRCIKVET